MNSSVLTTDSIIHSSDSIDIPLAMTFCFDAIPKWLKEDRIYFINSSSISVYNLAKDQISSLISIDKDDVVVDFWISGDERYLIYSVIEDIHLLDILFRGTLVTLAEDTEKREEFARKFSNPITYINDLQKKNSPSIILYKDNGTNVNFYQSKNKIVFERIIYRWNYSEESKLSEITPQFHQIWLRNLSSNRDTMLTFGMLLGLIGDSIIYCEKKEKGSSLYVMNILTGDKHELVKYFNCRAFNEVSLPYMKKSITIVRLRPIRLSEIHNDIFTCFDAEKMQIMLYNTQTDKRAYFSFNGFLKIPYCFNNETGVSINNSKKQIIFYNTETGEKEYFTLKKDLLPIYSISPDGQNIAFFEVQENKTVIYIYDWSNEVNKILREIGN